MKRSILIAFQVFLAVFPVVSQDVAGLKDPESEFLNGIRKNCLRSFTGAIMR